MHTYVRRYSRNVLRARVILNENGNLLVVRAFRVLCSEFAAINVLFFFPFPFQRRLCDVYTIPGTCNTFYTCATLLTRAISSIPETILIQNEFLFTGFPAHSHSEISFLFISISNDAYLLPRDQTRNSQSQLSIHVFISLSMRLFGSFEFNIKIKCDFRSFDR